MKPLNTQLIAAWAAGDKSTRLKAALAIGFNPEPVPVDTLVARCATEPDFYVRDMLTWALTRLPAEITVPRLLVELRSERAQARSQACTLWNSVPIGEAAPLVEQCLDPCRHRDCSGVAGFALQVDDGPVVLPLLDLAEVQTYRLVPSKATGQQYG